MDLVIDRKVWDRGYSGPKLLRFIGFLAQRKQCCVGCYLTALGMKDEDIYDELTVRIVRDSGRYTPPEAEWLFEMSDSPTGDYKVTVEDTLTDLNDMVILDDADRERQIAEIFAQHGVNVTFVD